MQRAVTRAGEAGRDAANAERGYVQHAAFAIGRVVVLSELLVAPGETGGQRQLAGAPAFGHDAGGEHLGEVLLEHAVLLLLGIHDPVLGGLIRLAEPERIERHALLRVEGADRRVDGHAVGIERARHQYALHGLRELGRRRIPDRDVAGDLPRRGIHDGVHARKNLSMRGTLRMPVSTVDLACW